MRILVYYDFNDKQIETLRGLAASYGNHEVIHAADEEAAVEAAPEAEVLIGVFRPAVFAAAPRLRWAQAPSAGMDAFLTPEVVNNNAVVSNAAGLYATQGAEHAWSLLLALSRGLHLCLRRQDRREWKAEQVVVMSGSTLGIIGLGGFGTEMARRAQGYAMTVLALDAARTEKQDGVAEVKPPTKENLHSLLTRSDAVMVACPLTKETYHLIGWEEFTQMKNTAYLVNVSRGGIIDEEALIEALKTRQIAGAGLDVCEIEPLPAESPLWAAPNLIITPHRAGASQHRTHDWFEFAYSNLKRYLVGSAVLNVIDKQRGF